MTKTVDRAQARYNADRLAGRYAHPQDDPEAFAVVQNVRDLADELERVEADLRANEDSEDARLAIAEADRDRFQREARDAAEDAGRRLSLLADIHSLLRAGRVDEAIGVIVGEAERSPALAERIGNRRLR